MSHWLSTAICLLYIGMTGQLVPRHGSQHLRTHSITSLHMIGDDVLLKIFHFCRPIIQNEDQAHDGRIGVERAQWNRERWWLNVVHVCRRWRYLVIGSASHLRLRLVCTYGTPVADMLAQSPLLPLIIDYGDDTREVSVEDAEGILLALLRYRRVCRIRLCMPASNIRRLVVAMDAEFSMLEYLYIKPLSNTGEGLILPETFKAPQIRHFLLRNIAYSSDMFHRSLPTPRVKSTVRIAQCALCCNSQLWRSLKTFVHIIDDNSLLRIFSLCRPVLLDSDENNSTRILQGGEWGRERWWYKLAHVCRRWRFLVFASPSHLGLGLVCKSGTPVADMLAHSPPLPLIIDRVGKRRKFTAKEEREMILALHFRNRVRRIRFWNTAMNLQKVVVALDGDFPTLEYLYLASPTKHDTRLVLPQTFRAPHLEHLILGNFAFPVGSPLLTTAVRLVTLSLQKIHPSAYFRPDDLLRLLSIMPRLETLVIGFHSPVSNREVKRQLLDMPITTHAALPNLRWFAFKGASEYMEALLPRMTSSVLEKVHVTFFHQLTYSIPNLLQFMSTMEESLRSSRAVLMFHKEAVCIVVSPREDAKIRSFYVEVGCRHLDWQVSSITQISNTLSPIFSVVERLALQSKEHGLSSEGHNEVGRAQWRELLRSFVNTKILRVNNKLVGELSRALQLEEGDSPLELFPELKELSYSSAGSAAGSPFGAFVDARQSAGRPVTLVHHMHHSSHITRGLS